MEKWQIYMILTILSWGTGQILIRKGFQRATAVDTFFMGGFWGTLVYLPYVFIHRQDLQIDGNLMIYSFFIILSYLFYYLALSRGNFSINSAITSSYAMVTLLLSQIFFSELLYFPQWIGIALILTGIVVLSFSQGSRDKPIKRNMPDILIPVFGAIYLGTGDFLSKWISKDFTYPSIFLVFGLTQFFQGLVIKLFQDKGKIHLSVFRNPYTLTGNFILSLGTLFFYLALFEGYASIVVPASGSFLIIVLLLARFILHERLHWWQYVLIVLIFTGNILVHIHW